MNTKIFVVVGIGVMAGGLILAAILQPQDTVTGDLPDRTPTVDDGANADEEPTPDPRQFEGAEEVIDPGLYDYSAVITTDKGVIEIDLFEEISPRTVNNLVFLAQNGYYDNLRWHRVVEGFVVQAGDPLSEVGRDLVDPGLIGTGGPGYETEEEPNEISNTRGTIAMAKAGDAITFGSQFFINLTDNPELDAGAGSAEFFPFGEVISGMDVVDEIEEGDVIQSIEIREVEKDGATVDPSDDDADDADGAE
jgi:cyclophilin family peptidyl-prolyl cis-trans isomerase